MLDLATMEHHLNHKGKFSLLDWLLEQNLLPYSEYEAWRRGKLPTLLDKIALDDKAIAALTDQTEQHAKALKLTASSQDYYSWDLPTPLKLQSTSDSTLHQQLTQCWQRPQDLMQPDLFMDNSAVVAENLLIDALSDHQWEQAEEQLLQLSKANNTHPQLGAYQDLLNYGWHMQNQATIPPDSLLNELDGLEQEVCGLAEELLRGSARDYIALAWRRLAKNLEAQPFDPNQPKLHCNYTLRKIPDWQEAACCLRAEIQCYEQPELIVSLIECTTALKQKENTLLLWCFLSEKFPEPAEDAIEASRDQVITELWQQFLESNDDWSIKMFPAFVLLREPGLIHHLNKIPALSHPASLAMTTLLQARHRDFCELDARKRLQTISPELLNLYLRH